MKYGYIIAILLCVFSCYNRTPQVTANSNLEDRTVTISACSKKSIEFGIIPNDTIVQAIFHIRNTGEKNLIIDEVDVECSCTGYILENDTILPDGETNLIVTFNTKGKEKGLQRKLISIRANTVKEYSSLFIKCIIADSRLHSTE